MEDVARRRRRLVQALAALWAASIVLFSSIPGHALPSPIGFAGLDKVVHFLEFGVLAFLLALGYGRFWLAVPITIAWGVLDELHQRYTPNRFPSVYDAAADAIGAVLGAALALWLMRRRRMHGHRS